MNPEKINWIPPQIAQRINIAFDPCATIFKISNTEDRIYANSDRDFAINVTGKSYTCSETFEIIVEDDQGPILQDWLERFRIMFNQTISTLDFFVFKENQIDLHDNPYEMLILDRIRPIIFHIREDLICRAEPDRKYQGAINVHVLDQAIARCIAAFRSSITNHRRRLAIKKYIENKKWLTARTQRILARTSNSLREIEGKPLIKLPPPYFPKIEAPKRPFIVKPIPKNKRNKWMVIESLLFNREGNSFGVSWLGQLITTPDDLNNRRTCNLIYDNYKSKYYIHVPRNIEPKQSQTRNLTCGIDPGIRTFLTVYSEAECYEIQCNIDFDSYFRRFDGIYAKFKIGKMAKRRYKRALSLANDKMTRQVKDFHFKVAKRLCEMYKVIKIGVLNVKSVVKKEGQLSKYNRRKLYALSHYGFRQILKFQGIKYGSEIQEVNEYLTTKTCSSCGFKKEVGASEVYQCDNKQCGMISGRDINAAKNIRYKEPRKVFKERDGEFIPVKES